MSRRALGTVSHVAPPLRELLDALYRGDIFLLPPSAGSLAIADAVEARVEAALGPDARFVEQRLDNDAIFERVGAIRRALFLDAHYHALASDLLAELGLSPEHAAFDPMRLRAILAKGHENPVAAPVYEAHRDTWYAHPPCTITAWVPLHDLDFSETFLFYPRYFAEPVPNDSERFEYGAWVKDGWDLKIGWQDLEKSRRAKFVTAGEFDPGSALGFSCRRGQRLLFSGAHFHRTLASTSGKARFSLDFRFIDEREYAAGRGAPNVDGRSRGSAVPDYIRIARSGPVR